MNSQHIQTYDIRGVIMIGELFCDFTFQYLLVVMFYRLLHPFVHSLEQEAATVGQLYQQIIFFSLPSESERSVLFTTSVLRETSEHFGLVGVVG